MPRRMKALPDPDDEEPLPPVEVPDAPDEPDYAVGQPGGPGISWVTMLGDGGRMP